jgi:hypothetical protein
MTVLDAIYSISRAWSSINPVMLVQSWGKLIPELEKDDLQGFPNKDMSKSNILDMVCAMRSLKMFTKRMLKNGYK